MERRRKVYFTIINYNTMCFHTDTPSSLDKPKPLIAKKDIKVYKVISTKGNGRYKNLKNENGEEFKWERGFLYYQTGPKEEHFKFSKNKNLWDIEEGLHSFATKNVANSCVFYGNFYSFCPKHERYHVVEMIIPKGALYFKNDVYKEYVSNQLLFPEL